MELVENAVVAGRFRLNRLIQRGGMGSVWHATHLGLDIPCAVKFVKGELLDNEDVVSRFEREAKSAAQLRSPHVVQIIDYGVCEGTPYLAMELLDGEGLDARLQRQRRLSPEELHKILSEVCRALARAHAVGIVHRDLKPANIFLVRDEDREITKVLDFGIAKVNELAGSATKTGALLGTPYYMSPEQAQGTRTLDARSDLWALAVIAFQALTGKLPFSSEALGDLLMKIMLAPIPIPSEMGPVPPGFDEWWAKATSREPAERFQTAKEFSDSLAVVCGISQVSSVTDKARVPLLAARAAQGSTPDARVGAGAGPSGEPAAVAEPPSLSTGASQAVGATPPPLSRSLATEGQTPGRRPGVKVAIALSGLLFASALIAVGWFGFREHGPAPTAGTQARSTAAVPANPPPAASATAAASEAAPVATAAPTASAVPVTPEPDPGARKDEPTEPAAAPSATHHHRPHPAPARSASVAPSVAPKPAPPELGF